MLFEQYRHETVPRQHRYLIVHPKFTKFRTSAVRFPQWMLKRGDDALCVTEKALRHHDFVADRYSIADIALYAYTRVADEGGFDLKAHPAVRLSLDRIRSQPKQLAITQS
jgi:glutathione S-transferase